MLSGSMRLTDQMNKFPSIYSYVNMYLQRIRQPRQYRKHALRLSMRVCMFG